MSAAERAIVLEHLASVDVDVRPVPYPEHSTVEEGKRLRGDLPGTFTKNLLLRDKKSNLYFLTAHEDAEIDLRTLHTRIGARGRMGFASVEVMEERLHVGPGTATPLALVHDPDAEITLVVDQGLEHADQLNFHPMVQSESIGLTWEEFTRFAHSTGHPPVLAAMSGPQDDPTSPTPGGTLSGRPSRTPPTPSIPPGPGG
ncbi:MULTISPECIES: YbaK/EbsC family protein [Brachybacterium]|uniref:YbaK/EbsC family protein n=1 Tax=Brachybacterium rhamnosum TaxID=173361 RepID=A0ABW4Q099_9MICO|nr:YbaK/EbsC family protein [Brachybacterium squillarum]MCW1804487.1 hypothetical protein [Brachybacterium squillarum]